MIDLHPLFSSSIAFASDNPVIKPREVYAEDEESRVRIELILVPFHSMEPEYNILYLGYSLICIALRRVKQAALSRRLRVLSFFMDHFC
jgi:hypothetical protein